MTKPEFIHYDFAEHKVTLTDPLALPVASGFLWNTRMMIQMNCRGYATCQFMQPEPAKYSNTPVNEVKGFMQPEPQYFSHYPGRFFYIREKGESFSIPYEPMRKALDDFAFIQGQHNIQWIITHKGLRYTLTLQLPVEDTVELWTVTVENNTLDSRAIELIPHFSIGYMSWMNQSADFDASLNAIVARKVTPYQHIDDYFTQRAFNDITFLAADCQVQSWTASLQNFEGQGGLQNPDALKSYTLDNKPALYETPVAVLLQAITLPAGANITRCFIFGAAANEQQIDQLNHRYLHHRLGFEQAANSYKKYLGRGSGCINVITPDPVFDQFVNHWLPRQVYYHGDVNRLSTDPQTRNYLQDHMGMVYINPDAFKAALLIALRQQRSNGEMPDGILLYPDAKLKYINQIPHSDHCVWLSICLMAYLNETGDLSILNERVEFKDSAADETVYQHIVLAMQWLLVHLDYRNLSFIAQGDWCDPMNMVGYKGKGVSSWLSMATIWAFNSWADICTWANRLNDANCWREHAQRIKQAVNTLLWDGNWYARGITDDGRVFGVGDDAEGRIYLNPQSWAMLSDTANPIQQELLIKQVESQLYTPYGVMLLAPAYTQMVEDIGRVTQKFPGVAENGAVYNHACAFYIYALYLKNKSIEAFKLLKQMLITQDNLQGCGQLPVFIPNYFRGAYYQFPEVAGRSSQLFNTGTVAWLYRTVVEQLFGIKGVKGVLEFSPQLPPDWPKVIVERRFQGAHLHIEIHQGCSDCVRMWLNGQECEKPQVAHIETGKTYQVLLHVPLHQE